MHYECSTVVVCLRKAPKTPELSSACWLEGDIDGAWVAVNQRLGIHRLCIFASLNGTEASSLPGDVFVSALVGGGGVVER
jgi:hypothetical protein